MKVQRVTAPAPLSTRLRFPVSVSGTVFNAVSSHPLVGVGVKLWRGGASGPAGRKIGSGRDQDKKSQFLGEARTDTSGRFMIPLAEAPGIKEKLIASKKEPKLLFTLVVEGQGGLGKRPGLSWQGSIRNSKAGDSRLKRQWPPSENTK